jgi:hypothetical protein
MAHANDRRIDIVFANKQTYSLDCELPVSLKPLRGSLGVAVEPTRCGGVKRDKIRGKNGSYYG